MMSVEYDNSSHVGRDANSQHDVIHMFRPLVVSLTRQTAGSDLMNGWVAIQPDVYRYAVPQDGGALLRSVIRNYLATGVRWE